ncbi:MAG TPA: acetoin utilization protein AcuC [Bacillota bacterium]|nr:acetoin utilization protein AcuC [Bacillota bacterium]
MKHKTAFVYGDALLSYHFHVDHPFNQDRVLLTKELLEETDTLKSTDIISPRKATDDEIELFHDPTYVEAVKKAEKGQLTEAQGLEFGLGTEDTPFFPHMHDAACWLVGGTLTAVDAIIDNKTDHALNLGGGLHHAFKRRASGFCIYNDAAVAITYIRKKYHLKVLYVDTDAHHGDGVQWAFYDDPNVCTFSIHETGRYLFPGTGNIHERGIKEGHGHAFNIPIDAFTEDESFLHVYETAFRQIAAFFKPDIIITQNGADAHAYDPLTHLNLSMKSYEEIPLLARELAYEYCNGKWIALGGGGYDMWRVAPRAWAQVWNVMKLGHPIHGKIPETWLSKWQMESPVSLPQNWQDDRAHFPVIPRKEAIEEKNTQLLHHALKFAEKSEQ